MKHEMQFHIHLRHGACDVGIYYGSTKTWTWVGADLGNGVANGQYQIYDLGIQQLTDVDEFFVSPGTAYGTTVSLTGSFLVDVAQAIVYPAYPAFAITATCS